MDRNEPQIYPYEEGFKYIRWDILDRSEGRNYQDSEIRKACMAECVMDYEIQPEFFYKIYVYNEDAKNRINMIENSQSIRIQVSPYMFP